MGSIEPPDIPTSVNKQGNDIGTQYRTGIYFVDPEDEAIARSVLAEAASKLGDAKPIAVELCQLKNFCRAESYHQRYLEANPSLHITLEKF